MHFQDGFEAFDLTRWTIATPLGNLAQLATASTRFGYGYGLIYNFGGTLTKSWTTVSADFYCGFAHQVTNANNSSTVPLVQTFEGSTLQVQIFWDHTTGQLIAKRNTTTLQSVALAAGTRWQYFNVWIKPHATTGRVVVKSDGITLIDFTGNTLNGGTGINSAVFQSGGTVAWIDDFWMSDVADLGMRRIYTLVPSGAGSASEFTRSTGSVNATNVDELPINAADYNSGTTGQKDLYALSDLPAGSGAIAAVQLSSVVKKSDAMAISGRNIVKIGSTIYNGTTTVLGDTATSQLDTFLVDPATATTWTAAAVNAMEIGFEVI